MREEQRLLLDRHAPRPRVAVHHVRQNVRDQVGHRLIVGDHVPDRIGGGAHEDAAADAAFGEVQRLDLEVHGHAVLVQRLALRREERRKERGARWRVHPEDHRRVGEAADGGAVGRDGGAKGRVEGKGHDEIG